MKWKQMEKQVRSLIQQRTDVGDLDHEQKEAIDRAIKKIGRGVKRQDWKTVQAGMADLVRQLMR